MSGSHAFRCCVVPKQAPAPFIRGGTIHFITPYCRCTNVSPLAAPCVIMAVGIVCHTIWQCSVACWMCDAPSKPPLRRLMTSLVYRLGHLAAVVAGLGYGIITNAVFDVLLCSAPTTISYAQYVSLRNDGSAAQRAGIDPASATAMSERVEVSFLRSNRSIVCHEGKCLQGGLARPHAPRGCQSCYQSTAAVLLLVVLQATTRLHTGLLW